MNRRRFLGLTGAGGAGLVIAFQFGCKGKRERERGPVPSATAAEAPTGPVTTHELNAWIRVGTDDVVTMSVPEAEMGQGVLTSLPMVLADELGARWDQVRSEHAPVRAEFGRQSTGGSTSIRSGIGALRQAGATARELLVAAAAARWGVPASECRAEAGVVSHPASQRSLRFGELAAAAAELEPPAEAPLRETATIVGQRLPRLDLPDKVTGRAVFGIDVTRPNMLVARILRPPAFGARLKRFDARRAKELPGVREVVEVSTGVVVAGDHYWAAHKGAEAVEVSWDERAFQLSSDELTRRMQALAQKPGKDARKDGNAAGALGKAKVTVKAVYEVPYLAHTPMEPLSCTADVRADGCDVWISTQSPTQTRQKAAEITGLAPERIQVHSMMLGGGFGRRSQVDFAAEAIEASKKLGKPVKLVWTREDDVRGGMYRPCAYNLLEGGLDADGKPIAWRHRIVSPSILRAFGPLPGGIDATAVEGASNLPYAIDHIHVTYTDLDVPVSTWFWRSVGSSQNAYVTEHFFDELAHAGKQDPVELRRALLGAHPRHARVLELAADKAGWGTPLPEGRARGVAVHECFGSIVAQVAEVSLEGARPRVHRVVCAVDCGQVINPDTIEAQMDSGIAYGLSAALHGQITLAKGRPVQSNFHDYPAIRIDEMPRVETHIVAKGDPHGGIGEPGVPPIAPALCNALLALTGQPVRRLPIVPI